MSLDSEVDIPSSAHGQPGSTRTSWLVKRPSARQPTRLPSDPPGELAVEQARGGCRRVVAFNSRRLAACKGASHLSSELINLAVVAFVRKLSFARERG